MPMFDVSFEIVTPESAAHGEAEERGMIASGLTLRDALNDWQDTRTNQCDCVQSIAADCSDHAQARSVTIINGMEFKTGATESRTLHFPKAITGASRGRLARLLGAE